MLSDGDHGPDDAFIVPSAREFAHVHPGYDGSMHLALPIALAADVIAKGWASPAHLPVFASHPAWSCSSAHAMQPS